MNKYTIYRLRDVSRGIETTLHNSPVSIDGIFKGLLTETRPRHKILIEVPDKIAKDNIHQGQCLAD